MNEHGEAMEPQNVELDDVEQIVTTVDEPLLEDSLLVEDVSIDGMCGVY